MNPSSLRMQATRSLGKIPCNSLIIPRKWKALWRVGIGWLMGCCHQRGLRDPRMARMDETCCSGSSLQGSTGGQMTWACRIVHGSAMPSDILGIMGLISIPR